MLSADQVRAVYTELLDEVSRESGRARRRLDSGGAFDIWASVLYPSKNLCIELGPFRQEWLPLDWSARSMRGFRIHIESQSAMAGASFSLLFELQDSAQEDLFCIFSSSMIASINGSMVAREAARQCWETLERWRHFFSERKDSLSREEQVGLFGELWLICKLADSGLDLIALIDCWTGSLKTDQDFQLSNAGLEVKTTTSVDSDRVRITNARQLDCTGMELLILARISLDERLNGDMSLPELVDDLRVRSAKASAGARIIFDERLAQVGYLDKHRGIYEAKGYSERSIDFFDVAEGFPKLVESDLPTGVTAVTYDISIASCEQFKVAIDYVCESLGALTDEQ